MATYRTQSGELVEAVLQSEIDEDDDLIEGDDLEEADLEKKHAKIYKKAYKHAVKLMGDAEKAWHKNKGNPMDVHHKHLGTASHSVHHGGEGYHVTPKGEGGGYTTHPTVLGAAHHLATHYANKKTGLHKDVIHPDYYR